ncbi:MAG: cephalosporin hydroxylase family protein [Gemmatimonadaceae bacterium]
MKSVQQFQRECVAEIVAQGADIEMRNASTAWVQQANAHKYSYHFEWLGRPIIQYPQDMLAWQELIWRVQPDLIIETGIAHGGSLIFSASMLELNAACGGNAGAKVLGIDIDIRSHNRAAIEAHPMSKRITMIEGSSVARDVVTQVRSQAKGMQRILVSLDSNHTHEHVLEELNSYAPLVSVGSYCVVFDTIIADLPDDAFPDRPWSRARNPKTAVHEYLRAHKEFEIDHAMDSKLLISVAPSGYLRRVS